MRWAAGSADGSALAVTHLGLDLHSFQTSFFLDSRLLHGNLQIAVAHRRGQRRRG